MYLITLIAVKNIVFYLINIIIIYVLTLYTHTLNTENNIDITIYNLVIKLKNYLV